VQLDRNRSRPRRTVRGTTRGHTGHDPRAQRWCGPQPAHGLGTGARETAGAAAHRHGDGGATATCDGDGEAAGCGQGDAALYHGGRGASYWDDGGAREAAVGWRGRGGRDVARGLRRRSASGVECGRCRDAALSRQCFKPRYRRGAWRPHSSGARRLTSGARLSAISELKFTPKEISSN
jgi:hypothetical protein